MNPYKVLGVARDANEKAIKMAYRELVRKWHPDLFQKAEEKKFAEEKIKIINEASEILLTPEKRAAYDAENTDYTNVYEYYANKKSSNKKSASHNSKQKSQSSTDIENEKQKKAIIQFLEVEYEHKKEIFDLFDELATGVIDDLFSEDEYLETLKLILEEQKDCISKINEIIRVAKKKQIKGLNVILNQAQSAIKELTKKANQTPKTLKQAKYVEETRKLTEKVNELITGFPERMNSVEEFDLLNKTWEFSNDRELTSYCEEIKKKLKSFLNDILWVEKITTERNIKIKKIALGDPNSSWKSERREKTLKQIKKMVLSKDQILSLNLQQLRKKFWKERCNIFENSKGQTIFLSVKFEISEKCKGTFICPPNVTNISSDAFYWLREINAVNLPSHLIKEDSWINLPMNGNLKHLIITFGEKSQVIDVSDYNDLYDTCMTRKGDYICIKDRVSWYSDFILVDEKQVYVYDEQTLCRLGGVKTIEDFIELTEKWRYKYEDYLLRIHTWAQVSKKLPDELIMRIVPVTVESAKKWIEMDKTNLEIVLSENKTELKERIIRLYIGLGALGDNYSHQQAEWLITQLDFEKMYRSRLERIPKEYKDNDPMGYVPKEAVEFVAENINNKDFIPYTLVFIEGYQLFKSEAKKSGVKLSPEFVILTAPQYIFHVKTNEIQEFAKQLLDIEESVYNPYIVEEILKLRLYAKRQSNKGVRKEIKVTFDDDSKIHYKYLDLDDYQTYLAFSKQFIAKKANSDFHKRFFRAEAENVFISSYSHAIEIIDDKNNRIAIVILNLLDQGELFADIMSCEKKNMDIIEAIKRALVDQMKCNDKITGISIGTNEAPRGEKYNEWRKVIEDSDADWTNCIYWIKCEYLFKNKAYGISHKEYRARFIVEGEGQYLNNPNRYITQEERDWQRSQKRRYRRYGGWW